MPTQSREVLKSYFEHHDTPDEPEFIDLIDSMLNLADPGTQFVAGTISASGLLADTYNLEAFNFQDISSISLTGSNQFGSTASSHIHGFTGSIQQSGSCDSYFLNNLSIGTKTSYQSCLGGLTILKNKTIGSNVNPINQAKSSSLLISGATSNGQLAVDSNEIYHYGNNLVLYSQGNGSTDGNMEFKVGNTAALSSITSSCALYLKYDNKIGIGTSTPTRPLSLEGANGSLPLFQIKNTVSNNTGQDVIMSFNRDNSDSLGFSIGIDSLDNSFKISDDGNDINTNNRITILSSSGNVGIGTTLPGKKLTIHGNVSASGHLFASASDASGTNYHTLLVDTASGQFYHTGSYGGGGGGGTTV